MKKCLLFIAALAVSSVVYAHPGGLNAEGCHTNRKTGEYHCHQHNKAINENTDAAPADTSSAASESVVTRLNDIVKVGYQGFTVWLDCKERAPVKFSYNAQRDTGNLKRYDHFMLDPDIPTTCQQLSSQPYSRGYDRGHQVPANHLDAVQEAIKQSNYMTNILPQTSQLNRGAWLLTEEIVECYRDIDELLVMGGVIWGDNAKDDYFMASHGVRTPDYFWKVIIRGIGQDERAIAWIMPNIKDATKKHLDEYLVTIEELEKRTGEAVPIADYAKRDKPSASWLVPQGCNKG
jgi:endonuclease G, mitochondrial